MKVNPKYLIYHDLIGLQALVRHESKSEDVDFVEIGQIIDETKNIVITKKKNEIKKYIKKDHVFRFKLPSDDLLEVNGTKIVGRPENRLRNLRRKRLFKNR